MREWIRNSYVGSDSVESNFSIPVEYFCFFYLLDFYLAYAVCIIQEVLRLRARIYQTHLLCTMHFKFNRKDKDNTSTYHVKL